MFNKICNIYKSLLLTLKVLKKIYKVGGYTTCNIININHGGILKGKKILITGGSDGIGFCIARKCINEGATVIITGRNEERLKYAKEKINNVLLKTLIWDISDIKQIDKYLKETELLFGSSFDILINNAAVINEINFPDVTEEIWDKIYSVNSKGLFFLTQAVCSLWLKESNQNLKKIINISSQGAFIGATYPYRLTKWDIAGLTQGLGIKMASHGIIVNGIAPGIIATKMQPEFLKQRENIFTTLNPIERFALPEEIAELAVFLISDASNFIVGQTIVCDGGFSLK